MYYRPPRCRRLIVVVTRTTNEADESDETTILQTIMYGPNINILLLSLIIYTTRAKPRRVPQRFAIILGFRPFGIILY